MHRLELDPALFPELRPAGTALGGLSTDAAEQFGLAAGTPVTVPRTYVDYVVTEFGIAELCGKTVQERARALCEIAHPDFRDMLRDEAKALHHA